MGKCDKHDGDAEVCLRVRNLCKPFSNWVDPCCDGLIRQQFRLRVNAEASEDPTVVYSATQFDTTGVATTAVQATASPGDPIFPFGTVVATNLSSAPFTFVVAGDAEEETEIVVPPGSQAAITALRISTVFVFPTDPIRGIFDFDIFFPTGPILT